MSEIVFTIGHSTHPVERFFELLKKHGITVLADVRSQPYSRANPQFNQEALQLSLQESGIKYVFLGMELGARSEDESCFDNGKVQYDRLSKTALFQSGLERVKKGMQDYRIALMCAEKDPLDCHRTILISRCLEELGVNVQHIHSDGHVESHVEAMRRLLRQLHLQEADLIRSHDEMLVVAYRIQGRRIAYMRDQDEQEKRKTAGRKAR